MNTDKHAQFTRIIEENKDRVLNICYSFLHNREDAEDTAQEVFVEVYRSLDKFRREARLSTWIHRIAVSRSLDAIRKKKRKKRMGSVKQLLHLQDIYNEPDTPRTIQPDYELERKERIIILRSAMEKLPQNQRVALNLSQIDGLSYQETANIMGKSLSSIESLIFRAKQKLKKILTREYRNMFS